MKLYTYIVSRLILLLARWCLRHGRYVDYMHRGRLYLRRYAICGHLTGDGQRGLSARLLYLHQMINPDLDTCLHDHPWPWAVSWIMLGGYREDRLRRARADVACTLLTVLARRYRAPALNVLRGTDFHRIAEIEKRDCEYVVRKGSMGVCLQGESCCGNLWRGTWTLFLAGPRRRAKPWGYLVPGVGFVGHRERHEQFGGEEKRGAPVRV